MTPAEVARRVAEADGDVGPIVDANVGVLDDDEALTFLKLESQRYLDVDPRVALRLAGGPANDPVASFHLEGRQV